MSPTREHTLPTLPENSDVKQSADEDEEDREEQIKYEKDNAEAAYALRNDGEDNDKTTDDTADPGPFYVQSSQGDNWELTWPIWHLLPRSWQLYRWSWNWMRKKFLILIPRLGNYFLL